MDWLTLMLTLTVGALVVHYLFFRKLNKLERMGVLHLKPWPIVGNLASAMFRRVSITEALDQFYRLWRDADYIGIYNQSEPVIMIRSPELMKSIAIKNFDHFVDHRVFLEADMDPLMGRNLVSLRGERWKEVRNLLSPAFTSSKMKTMFKLMSDCGRSFVSHLAERSADKPIELDMKESFTRYTTDVIATCAFGITVDSMKNPENDFYMLGRKMTNFEGLRGLKMMIMMGFPKFSRLLNLRFIDEATEKFFVDVVKETIDTRDREGITRPDMIQLMMESRANKPGEGPEMTILDMTAQALIFFFGGFDTASTAMCFIAIEIAINEEVQRRLQEEVDEVMERTKGEPTYEAINGMEYLDAVVNETMRLYPVAPFLDRMCVKTFELPPARPGAKSVTIEPGQNVWLPVYSVHRDPKYFTDPAKFDPDRFMGDRKKDVDTSTYLPFGIGPRMCIGNRFALLETKVVIFYLLSKCQLKPSSKIKVPLRLSKSSFNMAIEGGFWLQLEPRKSGAKLQ